MTGHQDRVSATQENQKNTAQEKIVGVSTPVLDFEITNTRRRRMSQKPVCKITKRLGGGGANALRQAQALKCQVDLVALLGRDNLAPVLADLIQSEFPLATLIGALSATRVSVIRDGEAFTTRPPLLIDELPRACREVVRRAAMVLIGPMSEHDFGFVSGCQRAASAARRTVLQLSGEQLLHRSKCLALMQFPSTLTILNTAETSLISGEHQTVNAIEWLHRQGVDSVLATSRTGAMGLLDGTWIEQSSIPARRVARTVGAGDIFVGTLMAALMQRQSAQDAVALALAACTTFIEGDHTPRTLQGLRTFARERSHGTLSLASESSRKTASGSPR
jgi:sugar/nucleoside kinase (ribokinase family)